MPSAFVFCACTNPAEHSNPLDPASPAFSKTGGITGTVTNYYPPFRPLANVQVRLSPELRLTFTNAQGEFEFHNLGPREDYEVQASFPGYATDTLAVSVRQRQTVTAGIRLKGLPRVDSVAIITERVASLPDSTSFFLEVNVIASDPDGSNDVKGLLLIAKDLAFTDTLIQVGRTNVWQRRFSQAELPNVSLPAWVGHPLHIRVEDFLHQQITAGPYYVVRVMQEVPEIIAPAADSLVNKGPLRFFWQSNPVGYPHTHEVEIFRIDAGFPSFFAAIRRIDASINNAAFPGGTLPPSGKYYWTVKIVDEFGNWSRSKEAVFNVQRP